MAVAATPPTQPQSTAADPPHARSPFQTVRDRALEVKELLLAMVAVVTVLSATLAQFSGFVEQFVQGPLKWTLFGGCIVVGGLIVLVLARMRARQLPSIAPIRGLLPYDHDDPLPARDRPLEEFCERLTSPSFRFFALSGPAGSGKTSLVRAGILPRLDSEDLLPICVQQTGLDPYASITQELPDPRTEPQSATFVELVLAAGELVYQDSAKKMLIICDQFDTFLSDAVPSDQGEFFRTIWRIVESDSTIRFLFVVSDDFLDLLNQLVNDSISTPASLDLVAEPYRLQLLTRSQAHEIVQQWIRSDLLSIPRGLLPEVINALTRQGCVGPAPLQVVAQALYQVPVSSRAQLRMIGGVEGILVAHVVSTVRNTPSPDFAISALSRLLPSVGAETLPIVPGAQLTLKAKKCRGRPGEAEPSKKQCPRILTETIAQLRRARIIVRRGPGRYSLADSVMHRAVRTAVADLRIDSPTQSPGETVLNSYVTRYGDDSSIVINRTDLQVIERTASVASRVQEPARTLLIQSMEVLRKRAVRKRALSIAGTVAVVLIGGTSAVYAIAISGFHETGPRFTMMHPTLGDPILASSVAVEPHGGSVVMTDPRSDTLGLYYWKVPEHAAMSSNASNVATDTAQLIPNTKGTRYTSLAFSPGQLFLSGGADGTVRLWNARLLHGENAESLPRESEGARFPNVPFSDDCNLVKSINGLAFDSTGDNLLVSGDCGRLELWNRQGEWKLEAVADLGQKIDSVSLNADGRLVAVRLIPELENPSAGLVILERDGTTLRQVYRELFAEMDLLSVQFMEKDRLAAVAAHGVLTAQGSQMRIERIEMNLLGPESKTYLGTAPINLSIKSVLMSRDTETVAVRVVGENDVPWRIWRRDQRSNDISLDANPGNVSEGALSWDGNQLILLQKNGNRVYQWGTWFAGIRLPWRG